LEQLVINLQRELADLRARQAMVATPAPQQPFPPPVQTEQGSGKTWFVRHVVTVGIAIGTALVTAFLTVYVNSAVMTERLKITSDEVANLRNQTKVLEVQSERIKTVSDELDKLRTEAKAWEGQTAISASNANLTNGHFVTLLQNHQIEVDLLRSDVITLQKDVAKTSPQIEGHSRDVEAAKQKLEKLSSDLSLVRERLAALEAAQKK
jgi:hypothetical protein